MACYNPVIHCSGHFSVLFLCFILIPSQLLLVIFLTALVSSLECLFYFLRLFIYPVIKAVTHIFIVGLKNRRACQFLSALAAVVLGVTKAKLYAAIPIAYGIFLTIPDLDPDPWMSFKLSFSHFLMANMDEESLNAVLYSKSFKMVSCNEMMPVLRPVRPTTIGACFVLRERFRPEDGHFTVEPEYKIGLGSITTATRRDEIDVQIFTPYSGVKRRRMKNTPRARFNLDMSARFWRDHPEVGILNEDIRAYQHYDEAKIHCISIDKWITFCGSENYVFMEYDCESFDTYDTNALVRALDGGKWAMNSSPSLRWLNMKFGVLESLWPWSLGFQVLFFTSRAWGLLSCGVEVNEIVALSWWAGVMVEVMAEVVSKTPCPSLPNGSKISFKIFKVFIN